MPMSMPISMPMSTSISKPESHTTTTTTTIGSCQQTNIPFINNAHYPFKSIYFLNYNVQRDVSSADVTIINQPTVDDCE
jgi:hypothetical protein